MPRYYLNDPRISGFLGDVIDLFLFHGSVNAVYHNFKPGQSEIYRKRLHALLSADPTRAINEPTLKRLQKALASVDVPTSGGKRDSIRAKILQSAAAHVGRGVEPDAGQLRVISDDCGIPLGVVQSVLCGVFPVYSRGSFAEKAQKYLGEERTIRAYRSPDWSFQDRAVHSCVSALSEGVNRRIGLVVPTGGGKTRIALRIILEMLHLANQEHSVAFWVTHRKELYRQARRELQRLLNEDGHGLPQDAVSLLENRIQFVMISDIEARLHKHRGAIEMVVVDEGHHLAAPSYQQIVETEPLRVLCATATPNRADGLPIHIDEIAFSITYRDLIQCGVLVEPVFSPPIVHHWSDPQAAANLADYLLDQTETEFGKTLVVVSRTEYTDRLAETIIEQLDGRPNHPLVSADIGSVHGEKSWTGAAPEDYLDEFRSRPCGILVATAQLIGEGFDDPRIDSIVVTYPSSSIAHLMQVAGRALRHAPGKETAHVVQCRESDLSYHVEQPWLYEDISDRLRPHLINRHYRDTVDLSQQVEEILRERNVERPVVERVLASIEHVAVGEKCQLLLTGLPYYGSPDNFGGDESWGAVFVTPNERTQFLDVFNDFSKRFGDVKDHGEFLARYIMPDTRRGSRWKGLMDMLSAMDAARREIDGEPNAGAEHRNYEPRQGTTWLTYISFAVAPNDLPVELDQFLQDAVNRDAITGQYLEAPDGWALVIKLPLPLSSSLAFLLDGEQAQWLITERGTLSQRLQETDPAESFATVTAWRLGLGRSPLPTVVIERLSDLVSESSFGSLSLALGSQVVTDGVPA